MRESKPKYVLLNQMNWRSAPEATESALALLKATGFLEDWCPQQWIMATSIGSWRASKRLAIRDPLNMEVPLVLRKPPSFQNVEWLRAIY